jgi:transcriptional regulator with XRE-family HTH domain
MRELRDAHGVTADAVAAKAREVGLGWQRSTVASIETGRRRLTAEELLLLPLLLSMALPLRVTLRDLLDDDAALTDELTMTRTGFAQLLDPQPGIWGGYRLRTGAAAAVDRRSSVERWRRVLELWPGAGEPRRLDLQRLTAVERSAAATAEQNAARALGCTALDVAALAHRTWGRGLTEERDARLAAGSDAAGQDPPSAVRTRRGHVTRQLLDELAPLLPEA